MFPFEPSVYHFALVPLLALPLPFLFDASRVPRIAAWVAWGVSAAVASYYVSDFAARYRPDMLKLFVELMAAALMAWPPLMALLQTAGLALLRRRRRVPDGSRRSLLWTRVASVPVTGALHLWLVVLLVPSLV